VPSPEHEALVRLFRDRPEMAARLLARVAGRKVPPFHVARVARADMPDDRVTEYHADLVVEHYDARGAPRMGVVVEVQLGRDPDKPFTWPYYCATLRSASAWPTRPCRRRCAWTTLTFVWSFALLRSASATGWRRR
jgi:hypothetical protein